MATSDLNATLAIRAGLQGGAEPWARTTTLELGSAGFSDPAGVGSAGAAPGGLDIAHVRAILLENFDRDGLLALLDHIVRLRDSLDAI